MDVTPQGQIRTRLSSQCFCYRLWLNVACCSDVFSQDSLLQTISHIHDITEKLLHELICFSPEIDMPSCAICNDALRDLILHKIVSITCLQSRATCNVCQLLLKPTSGVQWEHVAHIHAAFGSRLTGDQLHCPKCEGTCEYLSMALAREASFVL